MKIKSIEDIERFKEVIKKCEGQVWLESIYGDKYNLKSELSQYIAMAALLKDKNEDLELFASNQNDEVLLINFISTLSE